MTNTNDSTALDTYAPEAYWSIPADIRWANIRNGLGRSLELAQFTLRTGAERKGARFITRGEARDLDAGHWALMGRPE